MVVDRGFQNFGKGFMTGSTKAIVCGVNLHQSRRQQMNHGRVLKKDPDVDPHYPITAHHSLSA